MPYTHFRMIAYEVPTVAKVGAKLLSAWGAGVPCPPVARLPVPKGLPPDALSRLTRLASVVDLARQQFVASVRSWPPRRVVGPNADNANTLKVFVVPEFYFRPPETAGDEYLNDTYPNRQKNQILNTLNDMFRHDDFTDWLFVCGTVMANTEEGASAIAAQPTTLYTNTAILVSGGPLGLLHVVEKKVPSHIDGVPQARFSDGSTEAAGPGNDPKLKLFYGDWPERKRHIVDFSGVSVGLEICLDHANDPRYRVLRSVVQDWKSQPTEKKQQRGVQLHILTAGGMPGNLKSVAARAGGYLLRNDGLSPPPSQLWRVKTWLEWDPLGVATFPSGPQHARAFVRPEDASDIPRSFTVPIPAGPPRVPPPPGGTFPIDVQRIAFYPVTPLP